MSGDYPPNWDDIAEWVKRAAGYRCEHCGHTHERETGHVLTVHHLDGDKSNCGWRNLVAMCQRCHLHWQAVWQPGQSWLMDPPEWAVIRGLADGALPHVDELTPFDAQLLSAIGQHTAEDGAAHSLFQVAVVQAGLDYPWAHRRLGILEARGYVHVERRVRGHPMVMRLKA